VTGTKLELSCRAEAAPGIKVEYCWFRSPRKDGSCRKPTNHLNNRMTIPVCNDASEGHYLCEALAKEGCTSKCRISSRVARVKVVNSTDISIIKQPPNEMCVMYGGKLSLEYEASCKHHTVRYQWYKERYNGAKPLAGSTQSTLNIPSVSEEDIGTYYCEATSDYSEARAVSRRTQVRSELIFFITLPITSWLYFYAIRVYLHNNPHCFINNCYDQTS